MAELDPNDPNKQPMTDAQWRALLNSPAMGAHATIPNRATIPTPTAPEIPNAPQPMPASTLGEIPAASIPPLAKPTRQQSNAAGKAEFAEGMPKVTASPGTPEYGEQKQAIADYEKAHPWGSPISAQPGVLGKIGHVASRVANLAGDVLAPGVTALIPGSDLNKQLEAKGNAAWTRLGAETELQGAETEKAKADVPLEQAEAWKDLNPQTQGKTPEEQVYAAEIAAGKTPEEALAAATKKASTEGKTPAEQTYADLIRQGKTPEEALAAVTKPPTTNEAAEDQRYEKIKADQKLGHAVTPEDMAWAGAFEKRKTLAPFAGAVAAAPQRAEARSDKSYQYNTTALDKISTPIEQLNGRMGRLMDTLAQGSMQADALVAPELLSVMAGGAGSGLRMNEAEISRIVGGRTNWEDLKANLQKWNLDPNAARSITPDQDKQIRALVGAVKDKLDKKMAAIDTAREALLDTDDPKEHRKIVTNAKQAMDKIDSAEATPQSEGGGHSFSIGDKKYANVPDDVYQRAKKMPGFKE